MLTVVEAANDHRPLIEVWALDVIARQQDDARVPAVAVHTQVLAPLLHRRVPDHVGSPHVAVDVVAGIAAGCPVHCIELREIDFHAAFHHLLHSRSDEGYIVAGIVVIARFPGRAEAGPVLQIGGTGTATMGAKDIITIRGRIIHDGRIVDADTLLGCGLIKLFSFSGCELGLLGKHMAYGQQQDQGR